MTGSVTHVVCSCVKHRGRCAHRVVQSSLLLGELWASSLAKPTSQMRNLIPREAERLPQDTEGSDLLTTASGLTASGGPRRGRESHVGAPSGLRAGHTWAVPCWATGADKGPPSPARWGSWLRLGETLTRGPRPVTPVLRTQDRLGA